MMRLMKRAGVDFNKFLETKTDDEKTSDFYQVYKEDYQKFDEWVRFGQQEDKLYAMWIKMGALGMTYEEIFQDSERRDSYTPLNEKRKGKW
jgi:Ethanolamine utilization protein EutJ (predicted chaperonin)